MAKKYRARSATGREREGLWLLWGAAFFLLVCLGAYDSAKGTALVCVALAAVAGITGFSRLRDRFRLPMLALTLVVVMGGISTLYALSGKFALQEFLKLLMALCLALTLLALPKGEDRRAGRQIAFVLEFAAALLALLSIDLISTRLLSGPVTAVLGLFTGAYAELPGLEAGVRLTSLLNAPNVFAGCAAVGVLLSLGLVLSSEKEGERRFHTACLYVTALAFVLAFSMGAAAMIALAFVLYLLLERQERRAGLFVLMVETLLVTLIGAALSAPSLATAWDGLRPVPLLCAAAGSALLILLDRFAGRKVTAALEPHGKAVLVLICAALAALLAVGLLAYHWTGPADLAPGETLRRSAYPAPGEYALELEGEGAVTVRVTAQNRQDTMMHTETTLYEGPADSAAFTVPEETLVVWLELTAPEGARLERAVCQGAAAEDVPLDYKLLPGFIANRVQGLFANQNAIQRAVFFEDGMKLFARSPIVGLGLGSYENGIKSVQSFYYETKYAHNHYIQTLLETGAVGLVLFLGLLGTSAAAVVNGRRREDSHPLNAALGAALVFMAGHAAVEVDFSFFACLPFYFGVFALISLCCAGEPKWLSRKVRTGALAGTAALTAVFCAALIANLSAAGMVKGHTTFDTLERAARMDLFEGNDYKLSYVMNAINARENDDVLLTAQEFVDELEQVSSNTIPLYLAEYHFTWGHPDRALTMLEKYVRYVSSDQSAWNAAFDLLRQYDDGSAALRDGALGLADVLEAWNAENLGTVTLDGENQAYLAALTAEN